MAEALLAGAAVGAAFGELLKVVIDVGKIIVMFKSELKLLENTLISIQPMFAEIGKMNTVLNRPKRETDMFVDRLRAGTDLVLKCSRIPQWNYIRRYFYAKKMIDLDKSLLRFFQMDVQAQVACDMKKTLVEMNDHSDKLNRMLSIMKNGSGGGVRTSSGFAGSCGVPGLPDLIVGLDKPLRDLKAMLLGDGVSEVLISAPGGSGKTTLAQMLCHDEEIKGKFGEIFFVTVSKMADLKDIVRKIFEHKGIQPHEFQTDEDAIRQLEQLMRGLLEKGSILLVLDDVWSTWKSLIERFRFSISRYKILVTSRFEFRRFDSTYKLNVLNDKDADTLFRHSAFQGDGNSNIPDYLLKEIVKGRKGVPLALKVVGSSLYGQHKVKWRSLLKKWSKGQSIFESNKDEELLLRLKTSLDDLDEMDIMKECFLDLGAFPEDERIQSTTLMDMWAELYNLEDEDMETLENLLELSFRNLINLVPIRKDAVGMDGYCDEYEVMQHDLLRELAIHQSSQEPIEHRERLIIDISGNNLPEWWIEQRHQSINARLLSIFTVAIYKILMADEKFSSWYDMQVPEVEVLVLNFRTRKYTLPPFMERMHKLKVLIIKCCSLREGLNLCPNIPWGAGFLFNLRIIRLESVSISFLGRSLMLMLNLRKMSLINCWIDQMPSLKILWRLVPYVARWCQILPNLAEVEIIDCNNCDEFVAVLCKIVNLKKLSVRSNLIIGLPEGIGRMTNLEVLRLSRCIELREVPEWIGNLHKLRLLDISFCLSVTRMPERMGELCSLKTMDMRSCINLQELPASVKDLRDLEYVICDEQIAHQWEFHITRLTNLKITARKSYLNEESCPTIKFIILHFLFKELFMSVTAKQNEVK